VIDSEFIIRYTNALYTTDAKYAPRYDEFRDMFSSGQIKSKEWLVKELIKLDLIHSTSFLIAGAWFGTLGVMIKSIIPNARVTMLDIDPRCEVFVNNIIFNEDNTKYVTKDMYDYPYNEHIIINTSCEHIPDIKKWIKNIPEGKIVILQSNNYKDGSGHINCIDSEDRFVEQAGLKKIIYKGNLELPMYTRYMIIGTV
jgi:hypothetical protein